MASSAKCNLGNWIAARNIDGDVHFRSEPREQVQHFSSGLFDALESLFLLFCRCRAFCRATPASQRERARCVFMCYSGLSKAAAARRCRRITQKTANKDKGLDGVRMCSGTGACSFQRDAFQPSLPLQARHFNLPSRGSSRTYTTPATRQNCQRHLIKLRIKGSATGRLSSI